MGMAIAGTLPMSRTACCICTSTSALPDCSHSRQISITIVSASSSTLVLLRPANRASSRLARAARAPNALERKNWLFSGSDAGGQRAALFYTLIRTATLNGGEPEAWLRDGLARIGSHPINRLHELLPWNWTPPATQSVAA